MKKSIIGLLLCLPGLTYSQFNLIATDTLIDFGTTDELTTVTQQVGIYNPGSVALIVDSVDFFGMFGDAAFGAGDTSFELQPGDTGYVSVHFLPAHNVDYQVSMVVNPDGFFGAVPVRLKGTGVYSMPYYGSTDNLKEGSLLQQLKSVIGNGYNSLGYTFARDSMYADIDNVNGDVECVYTGRVATFSTRAGANNNSFNCEHTFPQGFFSQSEPMRSDIHHLFPTDVAANSQRGNDPFGVVTNPAWSVGGSKSGGGTFEPRDVQKGRTARAMMYFVLRYQDYTNFFLGQENILFQWHEGFPPDSVEKLRNDQIYVVQNNRNPFVDYPQFKYRFGSLVGNPGLPLFKDLYISNDTIKVIPGLTPSIYRYDLVVYNQGTEPINLFNFNLSDTALKFSQPLPDTLMLDANRHYVISIDLPSGVNQGYSEQLSFNTDIPNQNYLSLPIVGGTSISKEEVRAWELSVYPNPASQILNIRCQSHALSEIWISDLAGRRQRMEIQENGQYSIGDRPPGIYILQIRSTDGGDLFKRILIREQ